MKTSFLPKLNYYRFFHSKRMRHWVVKIHMWILRVKGFTPGVSSSYPKWTLRTLRVQDWTWTTWSETPILKNPLSTSTLELFVRRSLWYVYTCSSTCSSECRLDKQRSFSMDLRVLVLLSIHLTPDKYLPFVNSLILLTWTRHYTYRELLYHLLLFDSVFYFTYGKYVKKFFWYN